MQFTNFNNDYKYDTIAAAVKGREQEWFHYDFDKSNFETMLLTLPEGTYRQQVQHLLATTLVEMSKVEAIHAALLAQIDDQAAYDAAVARLNAA